MKSIKEKKYKIFSLIYRYSLVFVFMFSFVFSVFVINPVLGATEYWGYQQSKEEVFPCGYEEGKFYKVGEKIMSAKEACDTYAKDYTKSPGSFCLKSTDNICFGRYKNPPFYDPGSGTDGQPQDPGSGTDEVGGVAINTKIENPIGPGLDTLEDFIAKIIEIVLVISIPILVLMIIYTGYLFVSAQGNPQKLEKAKKSLLYTLIGGALILGAFVISSALVKTVEEIKSNT